MPEFSWFSPKKGKPPIHKFEAPDNLGCMTKTNPNEQETPSSNHGASSEAARLVETGVRVKSSIVLSDTALKCR